MMVAESPGLEACQGWEPISAVTGLCEAVYFPCCCEQLSNRFGKGWRPPFLVRLLPPQHLGRPGMVEEATLAEVLVRREQDAVDSYPGSYESGSKSALPIPMTTALAHHQPGLERKKRLEVS